MRSFAVIAAFIAIGCSGRADKGRCEQATRNVFQLTFWHSAEKLIHAEPPAQREAKRREMQARHDEYMTRDFTRIVSQCQAANDGDRIECMIKAKTCKEAKACMPDDTNVDISKECE